MRVAGYTEAEIDLDLELYAVLRKNINLGALSDLDFAANEVAKLSRTLLDRYYRLAQELSNNAYELDPSPPTSSVISDNFGVASNFECERDAGGASGDADSESFEQSEEAQSIEDGQPQVFKRRPWHPGRCDSLQSWTATMSEQ